MKAVSRWLAAVMCLTVITPAWAATSRTSPARPRAAKPALASKPAAAKSVALRVINFDLQGRKGPLPASEYQQIKALIIYLEPDLLVVHNVLRAAADAASKDLPKLASSLEMYYAFQPLTDTLGSALITKYPIGKATYLADPSGAAIGMQLGVKAKGQSYSVLVVRPPNSTLSKAAADVVVSAVKPDREAQHLLFASFSPKTVVSGTLKAWGKAGLFDPGTRLGKANATYPSEKPNERLDVILLSKGLREGATYRVVRDRRFEKLSQHLPVEVTLPQ